MRMVRGFYNEQNNTVNVVHYDTNYVISLDCGKWEQVFGPLPTPKGRWMHWLLRTRWSM